MLYAASSGAAKGKGKGATKAAADAPKQEANRLTTPLCAGIVAVIASLAWMYLQGQAI